MKAREVPLKMLSGWLLASARASCEVRLLLAFSPSRLWPAQPRCDFFLSCIRSGVRVVGAWLAARACCAVVSGVQLVCFLGTRPDSSRLVGFVGGSAVSELARRIGWLTSSFCDALLFAHHGRCRLDWAGWLQVAARAEPGDEQPCVVGRCSVNASR
jgi:hypothetical protein